jgi:hypothetical protein
MFQHTHIHHFTGQYSFMAICPIFGLIVNEAIVSVRSVSLLFRQPFASASDQGKDARFRLGMSITAAFLIVAASILTIDRLKTTYGLIRQTLAFSSSVEAKYLQAVKDICRQRTEVTLTDLQQASTMWGLEWRAKQLADTNQLPKCST